VWRLLKKLARPPVRERLPSVRMQDNIDAVDDLALSHEDAPDTHCTIARETGICRSPVTRIIHNDLKSLSA